MELICPCCNSSNIKKFGNYEDMVLFKCKSCNIIFQPEFSAALKNSYIINKIYQKYSENLDIHIKINLERIKKMEEILKIKIEDLDILEIGVGNGAFAHLTSKNNRYIGFEPYPIFWDKIDSLELSEKVYKHKFSKEVLKNKKFDIIVANDVIEHLDNPKETLAIFKEILKENGHIWLEVPDESYIKIKGKIRILFNTYINKYPTNPDHKILFNNKTFFNFLKNLNFKIIHYEISSVWGDENKLKIACSSKFYTFLRIISKLLRITKLDLLIGGNIIAVIR